VHYQPDGPAFDIVLVLHVGCVVVGLVTLVASISAATRLRQVLATNLPWPKSVGRYFRPGVNWAGRTVYGIPIFGFLLLALSRGAYSLGDGWIMAGLVILLGVVVLGEGTLWPAERRLQVSLETLGDSDTSLRASVVRDAKVMAISAAAALALLMVGSALMVAQP
jgi:hypothetical protein